jgi:hypothetical protein
MARSGRAVWMLACSLLALWGCGNEDERPAAACTASPDAVVSALDAAPGRVRVEGVALSSCLTEGSDSDDVQRVGTTYVEAAAILSRRASRRPEGDAALRLGYLVGAVRRGGRGTHGIHSELIRRLEQERLGSRAFRGGERAGLRSG